MTDAELLALMEKISNWGRWGKDDQRGTLNLLTIEKRLRAVKLASTGESVSMALPLATAAAPDNPTPAFHLMIKTGYDLPALGLQASTDYLAIPTHGRAITHLDALCHMFWRGMMYNGYPSTEVKDNGTTRCGIDTTFDGIIGRGVLLDIPKSKGVDWLEKGEKIFPPTWRRPKKSTGCALKRATSSRSAPGATNTPGPRATGIPGPRVRPGWKRPACHGCANAASRFWLAIRSVT